MKAGPNLSTLDLMKKASSGPDISHQGNGYDAELGKPYPQQAQHTQTWSPLKSHGGASPSRSCGSAASIAAGVLYSLSSAALTLLNKKVIKSVHAAHVGRTEPLAAGPVHFVGPPTIYTMFWCTPGSPAAGW